MNQPPKVRMPWVEIDVFAPVPPSFRELQVGAHVLLTCEDAAHPGVVGHRRVLPVGVELSFSLSAPSWASGPEPAVFTLLLPNQKGTNGT